MDAFMQKALAKSPADRFQTPREFIAALEEVEKRMRGRVRTLAKARLVIVSTGQVFVLGGTKMIVGREDPKHEIHPDIQIDDPTMTLGRKHARLMHVQGTWAIEDRNSRNKTRLNGEILSPYESHRLNDGDMLLFGRVDERFVLR